MNMKNILTGTIILFCLIAQTSRLYCQSEKSDFNFFPKSKNTAMEIYGTSAKNGLIVIGLKK